MTALAETRRPDTSDTRATPTQGSPRERLQRGLTLKTKDVELPPPVGRLRVRELRQWEKDEADEGVVRTEGDGKGNVTQSFDNRGHRTRLLVYALINDDGSSVYSTPLEDGVKEVGGLPPAAFNELWAAYDEINPTSPEAKASLVKPSAKATT